VASHALFSVGQRRLQVVRRKPWIGSEEVGWVRVCREVGKHGLDGDPGAANCRLPEHDVRIVDDTVGIGRL